MLDTIENNGAHTLVSPGRPSHEVYRHRRCSQWGVAVIVWEHEGKRAYRFEDGEERVFATEYCDMFEPVAFTSMEQRAEGIKLLAQVQQDRSQAVKKAGGAPAPREPSWEEQIQVFRRLFPGGFQGPRWQREHRGTGTERRLKRHRSVVLADAQEALSREACDRALADGSFQSLFQSAHDILERTDLVTAKQLEPLRSTMMSRALAVAFRDFLHEPDPQGVHFDAFLRSWSRQSQGSCTWPLMSALRALVHPDRDICIHPSRFNAQAKQASARHKPQKAPSGLGYNAFVAMANELRTSLQEHGLEPADLMDVYDFVLLTLRPSSTKLLTELRAESIAREVIAEEDAGEDEEEESEGESSSENDDDSSRH